MNIGKLNDAKAVERFRQAAQLNSFVLDAEHVGLGKCGASNMRQAKRKGTQRRIWLFEPPYGATRLRWFHRIGVAMF